MDEEEYRKILNPAQYRVMREKGTEEAFSGTYYEHEEPGLYVCAACGCFLFASTSKFDAENGWPTFKKPIGKNSVTLTMIPGERTEVACKKCASHLGYVAEKDGRSFYEINSIALDFHELPEIELEKEGGDTPEDKKTTQNNSSGIKTISLTIGGLTIGAIVGAGAMYASPQLICTPPVSANMAILPIPATASTGAVRPTPTPVNAAKNPPLQAQSGTATTSATSSTPAPSQGAPASATSSPASNSTGTI